MSLEGGGRHAAQSTHSPPHPTPPWEKRTPGLLGKLQEGQSREAHSGLHKAGRAVRRVRGRRATVSQGPRPTPGHREEKLSAEGQEGL